MVRGSGEVLYWPPAAQGLSLPAALDATRIRIRYLACRWVVPLLWLPVAALLARRALRAGLPVGPVAALAAGGVVLWQLIEYSLHRWLFHVVPSTRLAILAHFLMHGWASMPGRGLSCSPHPGVWPRVQAPSPKRAPVLQCAVRSARHTGA